MRSHRANTGALLDGESQILLILSILSNPLRNLHFEPERSRADPSCTGDGQQRSARRVQQIRHGAVGPADLETLQARAGREAEVQPRRVAGEIAAAGTHIAPERASVSVQRDGRTDGLGIAAARPSQVYLKRIAATQPVLEKLGRRAQVVDDDVQVAVAVQIGHRHAAAAGVLFNCHAGCGRKRPSPRLRSA